MAPPKPFRFLAPLTTAPKDGKKANCMHEDSTQVHLKALDCTPEQLTDIQQHYNTRKTYVGLFRLDRDQDPQLKPQAKATMLLDEHGLLLGRHSDLGSRWAMRWTTSWGAGPMACTRVLYQCGCGYSPDRRQEREGRKKSQATGRSAADSKRSRWTRFAPYDFTGCLGHIDVTFRSNDKQVMRIMGILRHNKACEASHIVRRPAVPLHPQVYEIALQQLQNGSNWHAVKQSNRHLIDLKHYANMAADPQFRNHRYLLLRSDSSRLFCAAARLEGIDTSRPAEQNVDNWLDPASPAYQPQLHQAVHYYNPRQTKEDRFEAVVASKEMEAATWQHAHGSQIILDGTFGICDSRLLLFVVMGVDQKRRGVPLAFLLFSAPTGNRQTSAGYNTEIMARLLLKWKAWLERGGWAFQPAVAITDTDTKERRALLQVFPQIVLLLCKFHLRQCWTNKRRALIGSAGDAEFVMQQAKARLQALEVALIDTTEHSAALELIEAERQHFAQLSKFSATTTSAEASLEFLRYLSEYWMAQPLWKSWSLHGRLRAAQAINQPVEGVLPTTNHLESFNRVFKRGHLRRLERGGKRLRFDIFFHYLISKIIPAIFNERKHEEEHLAWLSSRFDSSVLPSQSSRIPALPQSHPIAWIPSISQSSNREAEGADIFHLNRIQPYRCYPGGRVETECRSSRSDPFGTPTLYKVHLCIDGFGYCTCPDFKYRSYQLGACKHIYAFLALLSHTRSLYGPIHVPLISLPSNRDTAVTLYQIHSPSLPAEVPTPAAVALACGDLIDALDSEFTEPALTASMETEKGVDSTISIRTEMTSHLPTLDSNDQGIQEQLQGQLKHLVQRILPPLYQTELILQDLKAADSPSLLELSVLLGRLHSSLSARLQRAPGPALTDQHSSTPATPPLRSAALPSVGAGSQLAILPPSPEARQVRKNSYGTF